MDNPSRENNRRNGKKFTKLIQDFTGYTTAHGIGRLGEAKGIFWKVFWTVVCMGAFGMFITQTYGLFQFYFSKPVSTSVKITFKKKLTFPAVTICNLNMLRNDAVPDSVKVALKDSLKYDEFETHEVPSPSITNITTYSNSTEGLLVRNQRDKDDDADDDEDDHEIFEEYPNEEHLDPITKIRIEIAHLIAKENYSDLRHMGHSFQNLVQSCFWKGGDCKSGKLSSYWKEMWNFKYGNCFTFNSGVDQHNRKQRILKASKPGPSQGLVLELDIEQENYIGPLSVEAGVRILIHGQGDMPFPYEEGSSVSPGMATSIGLRKTKIIRLDRFKNGSCWKKNIALPQENLYRVFRNITAYSREACLQSCLGSSQWAVCSCSEVAYPSYGEPCDVFNQTTVNCLKKIKKLFNNDQLPCLQPCVEICQEEVIEKTISSAKWPSRSYQNYMKKNGTIFESDSHLLLNIFYNELNYEIITEEYSYGNLNLIADIGGQLGLWIGISFLTCCEVLELLIIMVKYLINCDKIKVDKKLQDNPTS